MARSPARRLLDLAVDATVSAFYGYHSRRRFFLQHERTLIEDARIGDRIKIVGRLRGNGPPSSAPLSGVTCLFYQTVVQLADGEGWGKKVWAERWPDVFGGRRVRLGVDSYAHRGDEPGGDENGLGP